MYRDVAYGWDAVQKLDIYLPARKKGQDANPVVFYVHGGLPVAGSKSSREAVTKARWANKNGWAFASIDYHQASDGPTPEASEDVFLAIAAVRGQSDKYRVDSQKIMLLGNATGGYLVSLVALNKDGLARHEIHQSYIRGVAVIDMQASASHEVVEDGPTQLEKLLKQKAKGSAWLSGDSNGLALNHTPPFWLSSTKDELFGENLVKQIAGLGFPAEWHELEEKSRVKVNSKIGKPTDDWTERIQEFYLRCLQDWLILQEGNCALVLSAPHDGGEMPDYIATRTKGVLVRDTAAQEITLRLAENLEQQKLIPFIVTTNLRRKKLDSNRPRAEATQGDPWSAHAWRRYHSEVEMACNAALKIGKGQALLLDLHAQGHPNNWFEIGHAIGASELAELAQSPTSELSPWVNGEYSLGGCIARAGLRAVPSPAIPHPNGEKYFNGGYITRRYRSATHPNSGLRSIQIEMPIEARKKSNRPKTAQQLCTAVVEFINYWQICF